MFHFCADEAIALTAILTSLPFAGPWLRTKVTSFFNRKRKPHCCDSLHHD